MRVRYRKERDGRVVRIEKRGGVEVETVVSEEKMKSHEDYESIIKATSYIIGLVIFLKACVF